MSGTDYPIGSHDLSLSDWRPYAKETPGFSKQIDGAPGDRCPLLFAEDRPVKRIVYRDRQAEAVAPRPGLWEISLEKNSGDRLIME